MADCHKIPYRAVPEARMALHAVRRTRVKQGRRAPSGYYLCPRCRHLHLTSQSGPQVLPWDKRRQRRSD